MDEAGIIVAGIVHGVFVFFKAFQQQNVIFNNRWWVVPTSYAMSATDVFIMSLVAFNAAKTLEYWWQAWQLWPLALSLGTGSTIGVLVAMQLHRKYVSKEDDHANFS